jgi:hypothetical protein
MLFEHPSSPTYQFPFQHSSSKDATSHSDSHHYIPVQILMYVPVTICKSPVWIYFRSRWFRSIQTDLSVSICDCLTLVAFKTVHTVQWSCFRTSQHCLFPTGSIWPCVNLGILSWSDLNYFGRFHPREFPSALISTASFNIKCFRTFLHCLFLAGSI